MKLTLIIFGIMSLGLTAVSADAQSIIFNSDIGARNIALSSADVSEFHDISSLYQNPAAMVFLKAPSVFINHVQGNYDEMQENIASTIIYDRSQMLALGAEFYNLGELNRSQTYQGYRFYEMGYQLAYARLLESTFSVGGTVSFHRGIVIQSNAADAASYSLGVEYAPTGEVSYALALNGLGTGLDYETKNGVVSTVQAILPRKLDIGATMRFPAETSLETPFLYIALASEKVFGITGINYKVGIEFLPFEFIALRFGYASGSSLNRPTWGLGFHAAPFSFDFAVYPVRVNGSGIDFEQMSASLEF